MSRQNNKTMTMSSGSSRQYRRDLVDKCMSKMALDQKVPLGQYYDYAKALLEDALRSLQFEHLCVDAYVKLMQFTYVATEIIPMHNSYKQSLFKTSLKWLNEKLKYAVSLLEALVKKMDKDEDSRAANHVWSELIDEFDVLGDDATNAAEYSYAGNSSIPSYSEATAAPFDSSWSTEPPPYEDSASAPPLAQLEESLLLSSAGLSVSQPTNSTVLPLESYILLTSAGHDAQALEQTSQPQENSTESNFLLESAGLLQKSYPGLEANLLIQSAKVDRSRHTESNFLLESAGLLPKNYPGLEANLLIQSINLPAAPNKPTASAYTEANLLLWSIPTVQPPRQHAPLNFVGFTDSSVDISTLNSYAEFPTDRAIVQCIPDVRRFRMPFPAFVNVDVSIGRETFQMQRHDFSLSFTPFFLNTDLPSQLQFSQSIMETNRCFFLHLGVAVQLHPFYLQTSFRFEAHRRMKEYREDDIGLMMCNSVLEKTGLVDANVLCYLWPREFDRYTICIMSGSTHNPILSVFRPRYASDRATIEVIMHCENDHFTLLKPLAARDAPFQILDYIVSQAKRAKLVVQEYEIESSEFHLDRNLRLAA